MAENTLIQWMKMAASIGLLVCLALSGLVTSTSSAAAAATFIPAADLAGTTAKTNQQVGSMLQRLAQIDPDIVNFQPDP